MITKALIPLLLITFNLSVLHANDLSVVQRWLDTNASTQSLKVDFVQSRTLKALKNPLVQEGTMWLNYPTNQFRWQLGTPAKTIVVSKGANKIAVMRTPLKRVEFRESGQSSGAPGLSSLTRGFPKTLTEFQTRYRILSISQKGNSYEILTQPKSGSDGVSRYRFIIDQSRFLLKGMIIELKDGSVVTTTFKRVDRNPTIQAAIFAPDMSGYKQTKFRQG